MESKIKVGELNTLYVERETPLGFMLSNGDDEVFMHKYQAVGDFEVDEEVEVFIYIDSKKRMTATMQKPIITTILADWVEVVDVDSRLGVFVNIGIVKDCLLSKDDLPYDESLWPRVGEKLFCRLKTSQSKMVAKMVSRFDLSNYIEVTDQLNEGDTIEGTVVRIGEKGTSIITTGGHHIFVYVKNIREQLHIGQIVTVKIIQVKELGEYNGTLIERKEKMIDKDSELILNYLKENEGSMTYYDKSNPDDIQKVFRMSKVAFKRALGNLMKQGLIEQNENGTKLK